MFKSLNFSYFIFPRARQSKVQTVKFKLARNNIPGGVGGGLSHSFVDVIQ